MVFHRPIQSSGIGSEDIVILGKCWRHNIRNDALWWNFEEALADLDLDTPSMAIPEMLDASVKPL